MARYFIAHHPDHTEGNIALCHIPVGGMIPLPGDPVPHESLQDNEGWSVLMVLDESDRMNAIFQALLLLGSSHDGTHCTLTPLNTFLTGFLEAAQKNILSY